MRTWLRCVPDLVILEETRRGGRQCATDLAGPTKVTLATPAEIKVDLIVSHFVRRHLPFSETIEGGKKENNVAHDARCIEHFTRQGNHGWRHRPQCVRRRFVGRRPDLAGMESSRQRCRNRSGPCLAESKSQQARAQEHEAGCSQGKKSVGNNVVVAHVTPTTQMLVRIY